MATLTLEYDDYPATVTLRIAPVSLDEFFAVRDALDNGTWTERASLEALCEALAPLVESWTFDRKPDKKGLLADVRLAVSLAQHWDLEVRTVPAPLPKRSSDGTPSADQTTSPASTSEPS